MDHGDVAPRKPQRGSGLEQMIDRVGRDDQLTSRRPHQILEGERGGVRGEGVDRGTGRSHRRRILDVVVVLVGQEQVIDTHTKVGDPTRGAERGIDEQVAVGSLNEPGVGLRHAAGVAADSHAAARCTGSRG